MCGVFRARMGMARQVVALDRNRQLYLPGFTLTATGLAVNKSVTEKQWEEAGRVLGHIHGATLWWIGDWLIAGEKGKWCHDGKYEDVSERFGIEYRTARQAVWIARAFELSRRRDNLTWSHHQEVAGLDKAAQEHWLSLAESEGWSKAELRKRIRASLPPPDMVDIEPGKYRVIYADPPWQYNDSRGGADANIGSTEKHYDSVSTAKLCEMAVASVASKKQSVLFLWATAPMLPDAHEVMEAWGFVYKSQFVWDKQRSYFGHYNHVQHELLFIGTRGSCVPKAAAHKSLVSLPRGEHSEKPEHFATIITEMYPRGPYLEMFARRNPDRGKDWTYWGNEIETDVRDHAGGCT